MAKKRKNGKNKTDRNKKKHGNFKNCRESNSPSPSKEDDRKPVLNIEGTLEAAMRELAKRSGNIPSDKVSSKGPLSCNLSSENTNNSQDDSQESCPKKHIREKIHRIVKAFLPEQMRDTDEQILKCKKKIRRLLRKVKAGNTQYRVPLLNAVLNRCHQLGTESQHHKAWFLCRHAMEEAQRLIDEGNNIEGYVYLGQFSVFKTACIQKGKGGKKTLLKAYVDAEKIHEEILAHPDIPYDERRGLMLTWLCAFVQHAQYLMELKGYHAALALLEKINPDDLLTETDREEGNTCLYYEYYRTKADCLNNLNDIEATLQCYNAVVNYVGTLKVFTEMVPIETLSLAEKAADIYEHRRQWKEAADILQKAIQNFDDTKTKKNPKEKGLVTPFHQLIHIATHNAVLKTSLRIADNMIKSGQSQKAFFILIGMAPLEEYLAKMERSLIVNSNKFASPDQIEPRTGKFQYLLAYCFYDIGVLEKALEHAQKAFDIEVKHSHRLHNYHTCSKILADICKFFGMVYSDKKEYRKAMDYYVLGLLQYRSCLGLEDSNLYGEQIEIMLDITHLQQLMKIYNAIWARSSIEYIHKTMKEKQGVDLRFHLIWAYSLLASTLEKQWQQENTTGKSKEAQLHSQEMLDTLEEAKKILLELTEEKDKRLENLPKTMRSLKDIERQLRVYRELHQVLFGTERVEVPPVVFSIEKIRIIKNITDSSGNNIDSVAYTTKLSQAELFDYFTTIGIGNSFEEYLPTIKLYPENLSIKVAEEHQRFIRIGQANHYYEIFCEIFHTESEELHNTLKNMAKIKPLVKYPGFKEFSKAHIDGKIKVDFKEFITLMKTALREDQSVIEKYMKNIPNI